MEKYFLVKNWKIFSSKKRKIFSSKKMENQHVRLIYVIRPSRNHVTITHLLLGFSKKHIVTLYGDLIVIHFSWKKYCNRKCKSKQGQGKFYTNQLSWQTWSSNFWTIEFDRSTVQFRFFFCLTSQNHPWISGDSFCLGSLFF